MFESRCGVACKSCERKEKINCRGCIQMAKPFWGGECEVKSCCESKGLDHCGVCTDFACETLSNMGKEQGYDPQPRLDRCKEWAIAEGQIRNLTKEDLEECSVLYTQVFNGEPWNDEWTTESATKRLQDIFISANFLGFVYVNEGKIIGSVLGNLEHFYDGIHYNLREMFISSELQGNGAGSILMNSLEKELSNLGVNTIILFTSKGNRTSNFYIKNGFSEYFTMAMMGKDIK